MKRLCGVCGEKVPAAEYIAHRQAHANAAKPSPAERGYGTEHRRLRAHYERQMASGVAIICWRCLRPIVAGEPWDLGHDDLDRSKYRGPEHEDCNAATAAHRAARALGR